jgi:hypothetical protein
MTVTTRRESGRPVLPLGSEPTSLVQSAVRPDVGDPDEIIADLSGVEARLASYKALIMRWHRQRCMPLPARWHTRYLVHAFV